ncbi:MAG TPA: hypothetical protein VGJ84_19270 [Polyangiaceae bacterium]
MEGAVRLRRVGVFSPGILRIAQLKVFLGCDHLAFRPSDAQARTLDAVIGWGHKPTASSARTYAQKNGLKYLALEDGFLRSIGPGKREPPLSMVLDDVGIYYDARVPSRLEHWLGARDNDRLSDPGLLRRARCCRERIAESGVSKYNQAPDDLPSEIAQLDEIVVVADQTFEDASVTQGLSTPATFQAMLEAAISEHPDSRIVVKMHPETVRGKKRGYLSELVRRRPSVMVVGDVSPMALLRRAKHLYVCTSQLGFDALLARVPVTCLGVPFYAGWGLTDDRQTVERRGLRRTLDQLVAAVLLLYPRYVHPISGELCAAEEVIEHLALHRRLFAENRRRFFCFGFSLWKRPFVRRYLHAPGGEVRFVATPDRISNIRGDERATAIVWASRKSAEITGWATDRGIPLWNMEDGFLRSVGLGSDLTPPGSLVLDREGIYYDPRQPSELENMLERAEFSAQELERARKLRKRIIDSGVSKYNAVKRRALTLGAPPAQRIVLVPGQVEDDAAVRYGTETSIRENMALLRAVRRTCPDAYVVYKPHPDVLRGNRVGAVRSNGENLWDQLIEHESIAACLALAHEVHTISSLVGFEALLRGLPVTTYGQPFYAGWGLTRDDCRFPRRTRRLSVDQLVAGALLRYPRYFSWTARRFCTAEDMVWELERQSRKRRVISRLPRHVSRLFSLAASAAEWARTREWARAG